MHLVNPLSSVLSSRAKVAALRVLWRTNAPLNVREIARRAGIAEGHASRTLRELGASGLLLSRDQGRVITYEIAPGDNPLVKQLGALFAAEAERYDKAIAQVIAGVPGVLSVILYGSEARGEARADSDTDLLIVVEKKTEAVETQLRENHLRAAEDGILALSWEVASPDDLREWEHTGDPLWESIKRDGLTLRGKTIEGLQRLWQPGATG